MIKRKKKEKIEILIKKTFFFERFHVSLTSEWKFLYPHLFSRLLFEYQKSNNVKKLKFNLRDIQQSESSETETLKQQW